MDLRSSPFVALCILVVGLTGCMADDGGNGEVGSEAPESLTVASSAFDDGARIPDKYTCVGSNIKPPLVITAVPEEAASLVLIMDDPDAPRGTVLHYTAWNIPPGAASWEEGADLRGRGAVEGATLRGEPGFFGPCPPRGDDPHRYFFRVYALDRTLDLESGASRDALESAMDGHVVARGTLIGTYSREASV